MNLKRPSSLTKKLTTVAVLSSMMKNLMYWPQGEIEMSDKNDIYKKMMKVTMTTISMRKRRS